ncbi:DUF6233 domain-containing protein [Streptomyces sp. NBC_01613]|uniref:DUF6233 domain-containing protein n=1 Tax=Streptomyces sp. NBC_01613 TaxID=2975896 RepID=UPI0038699990
MGLNRHAPPLYVHVGDCWNAARHSRPVSRDQARRAFADGVKAGSASLDTALGMLD